MKANVTEPYSHPYVSRGGIKLAAAKSPPEKERLQRDIESTDRQIDRLVYELYGLTDEEIRIVEDSTRCLSA